MEYFFTVLRVSVYLCLCIYETFDSVNKYSTNFKTAMLFSS